MAEKTRKKTVIFFHPDLGIGGAERLVVDAAVGLKNRGHRVVVFTSYCNPKHCFDEARDGTLDVRVRGNIIPSSILSRFSILCAILRQLHLLLQIHLTGELAALEPDFFFIDQLSAGLPLLQWLQPSAGMFFYCHFPDKLLAQGRTKWWRRLYRLPFDWLEQWSMSFADAIAVNSKFTRGVVTRTWPSLARKKELKVVYPCIDIRPANKAEDSDGGLVWKDGNIILSINRFERKKDIALAIKAFAGLPKEKRKGVRLVVAGGYDNRVPENVFYHSDLVALADTLNLTHATTKTIVAALNVPSSTEVLFLLSVPNALKEMLLSSARLLVYTPSNEHFGIVPLEAMLKGVPVLAANTGGPTETVLEGKTGWLRDPEEVGEWTKVIDTVLNGLSKEELKAMAETGKERVRGNFADTQMAATLDGILDEIRPVRSLASTITLVGALLGLVAVLGAAFAKVLKR